MSYASAIWRARFGAGLSQRALSERAGLSLDTISAIERGVNAPSRATLRRIAEALGTSLEALQEAAGPEAVTREPGARMRARGELRMRITIEVPVSLRQACEAYAEREGTTISALCREGLEMRLRE